MSELKNLKKIKGFDINEFDGLKSEIENVELLNVESKDFGKGAINTRQIKITTKNLATDGSETRGTEYVSLKFDNESKLWGYPEFKDSKAMKILTYFDVKDFEELKNKNCVVLKKLRNGDKLYLGINYGN